MLSQFKLPRQNHQYKAYCNLSDSLTIIRPLSQINYFIGPNNSGKSRLLRQLLKDLFSYNAPKKPENASQTTSRADSSLGIFEISFELVKLKTNSYTNQLQLNIRDIPSRELIKSLFDDSPVKAFDEFELLDFYNKLSLIFSEIHRNDFDKIELQRNSEEKRRQSHIYNLFSKTLSEIIELFPKATPYNITYVPAFRTLRKFVKEVPESLEKSKSFSFDQVRYYGLIDEQIFKSRVVLDYFENDEIGRDIIYKKESPYSTQLKSTPIFTGETLYDEIKKLRNSGEKDRKTLRDFESFLSDTFFESKSVELNALDINEIRDIYIKIGIETEFPIYHLGDGIQAIILLTFPLFINQNSQHQIFYEEPELYLHPGMQRVFIDALTKFPKTQAYIATHSNHLLDTSLDYPDKISIFSLRKNLENEGLARFQIENLSSPALSILNELGVRNSSVLLSNCSIWVEGISDRLYLKRFLDIYIQENPDELESIVKFNEDLHYSFFEFGGNNIEHYQFSEDDHPTKINALYLSNRIFLVHDKDHNKQNRHNSLKEQLGENYYALNALEIENVLSAETLRKTLNDFLNDEYKDQQVPSFEHTEYQNIPLGVFVQSIAPKGLKKIFSSGDKKHVPRLYNRMNFAQQALKYNNAWSDLNHEAQLIARKLYQFITLNNQTIGKTLSKR